jgi:hypothetical protein
MNKVSDTARSMRPASMARVGLQEIRLPLLQPQGPALGDAFHDEGRREAPYPAAGKRGITVGRAGMRCRPWCAWPWSQASSR